MKKYRWGSSAARLEREILFTIGVRFLPRFQNFRRSVIAHIVLRNTKLLQASGKEVGTKALVHLRETSGAISLRHAEILEALHVLDENGLITVEGNWHKPRTLRITVTSEGSDYLEREDQEATSLLDSTCQYLFDDVETADRQWRAAFIAVLCEIFSLLGREYVAVLSERKFLKEVLTPTSIFEVSKKVARRYAAVDCDRLARKLHDFFAAKVPEHSKLIWQMAQGFYALKTLGAGKAAEIFSESFLSGKELYLDTNVLFPTVFPGMPRHQGMKSLARLCFKAGASLRVAQVTLDEFARSTERQIEAARRVAMKIPNVLAGSIGDPIYYAILAARESSPEEDLEAILAPFAQPRRMVKASEYIKVVDDPWFVELENSNDLRKAAEIISKKYKELKKRKKTSRPASHDAAMLMYMLKERSEGRDSLLVSLDTTLPFCRVGSMEDREALVVPLDALLQWVCPALLGDVREEELATVFATALSERLFPAQTQLHLEDFRILDEFGLQCDQLPIDDLQDCIEHLQRVLPSIDPTTAEGREKLVVEMGRFLAAPQRHFQQELEAARKGQKVTW